jgi:glutaminyl-peptide cyclotransferase
VSNSTPGRPPRLALLAALSTGCLIAALAIAPAGLRAQQCAAPAALRFDITEKIVRSELGFTQGLEFHGGQLYESTGRIGGTTRLNVISLNGLVTTLADHGTAVFGEGLTILKGEIFQLTWQEHLVFVHDLAGKLKRTMRNPRDGWGLANDGKRLIFSDGGGSIYFAEPETFAIKQALRIRSNLANEVKGLNELEFVRGRLFGNMFTARAVVRIDVSTGCIDAVADLAPLWSAMPAQERAEIEASPENVLNGIAYDDKSGLFYLTGKRWKTIFVGRLSEGAR